MLHGRQFKQNMARLEAIAARHAPASPRAPSAPPRPVASQLLQKGARIGIARLLGAGVLASLLWLIVLGDLRARDTAAIDALPVPEPVAVTSLSG